MKKILLPRRLNKNLPFFRTAFLGMFCLFQGALASAADNSAAEPTQLVSLIRPKSEKAQITALKTVVIPEESVKLTTERFVVVVRGRFQEKDSSLLIGGGGGKALKLGPDGDFAVPVLVNAASTPLKFTAVNPLGQASFEVDEIRMPTFAALKDAAKKGTLAELLQPGGWRVSAGLGATSISYAETQTGVARNYSGIVLTGKASVGYAFSPSRWDANVSAFMTLFSLSQTDSTGESHSVRFLGVNARVGYRTAWLPDPWTFSLNGGVYFSTMLVSPSDLGFQNLAGPQLFPVVRYGFSSGNALAAYFKFSPIGNGFSLLSLSNREIAGGAAFVQKILTDKTLAWSVDIANLSFGVPSADNFQANVTSISFGAAFGF